MEEFPYFQKQSKAEIAWNSQKGKELWASDRWSHGVNRMFPQVPNSSKESEFKPMRQDKDAIISKAISKFKIEGIQNTFGEIFRYGLFH